MGWQHIRQSCELENCDHLQLRCNRLNHHDIEAIGPPIQAMSHNRPKLNYKVNSLGATCFSALTEFRMLFCRISRCRHTISRTELFLFLIPYYCGVCCSMTYSLFFRSPDTVWFSVFICFSDLLSTLLWYLCAQSFRDFYLFRYTWLLWSLYFFCSHIH